MIGVEIKIASDTADPALVAKLAQCDPHTIATKVVVPVREHWRAHLAAMPRNKGGYPSTGFWQQAARSVQGVAVGPDAVITADRLGLRQRLYGGTIKAKNAKNLTIPICAEAYGTTVADWGDNLVLVILGDGRKFLALWLGTDEAQSAYHKQLGKLSRAFDPDATQAQRDKAAKGLWKYSYTTTARVGKLRSALASSNSKKPKVIIMKGKGNGGGSQSSNLKFLFVLKESVEQAGNPMVLPQDLQEFAIEQVWEATN